MISHLKNLAVFALLALAGAPLQAITITPYSATVNQRFTSGFNTVSPVPNTNPSFAGAGYDWSGVGWNTTMPAQLRTQNFAMVTPLHAFSAKHYTLEYVGMTLGYVNRSGQSVTAPLTHEYYSPFSDALLSKLAAPVSAASEVSVLRVLDISSSYYAGQPLFAVGSTMVGNTVFADGPLVATSVINSTDGGWIYPGLQPSYPTVSLVQFESGDSGSPTIIPYKGKLTIAGEVLGAGGMGAFLAGNIGKTVDATYATSSRANAYLSQTGYLLKWTIYDKPSDPANTANRWIGGNGTGDFGAGTNWSKGAMPDVPVGTPAGFPVIFDAAMANGQRTVTLGADRTLRGILFTSAPAAGGFTFLAGNTLTVGITGIRNEDSQAQTFHSAITLSNCQNWEAENGPLVFSGAVNNGGFFLSTGGPGNITIAGQISGAGGFAREGAGTTYLNGTNTYGGTTWIHEGAQLSINNIGLTSATGTSSVIIEAGGTFAGTGRTTGNFTQQTGGRVAPGMDGEDSIGSVTLAGATNSIAGTISWDLNANSESGAGTSFDQIVASGNGTLAYAVGANLELNFGAGVNFSDVFWQSPHTWTILDNTSGNTVSGASAWSVWYFTNSAGTFTVLTSNGVNSDLVLHFSPSSAPPSLMTITRSVAAPSGNVQISYNPISNNNDVVKWNGTTLNTQVHGVGQTFTTGATGFNLSALSVLTKGGVGTGASGAVFVMRLYKQTSASGFPNAGAPIATLTGITPTGITNGDYLTFTPISTIALDPNSHYSFDLNFTDFSADRYFGIAGSTSWAGAGTFYNGEVGGFSGDGAAANTAVAIYNKPNPASYNFIAQGTPLTGYQNWLSDSGLPLDGSGDGSPTATPANDGLQNLIKYALDLDPFVSGNGGHLSYGTMNVSAADYLTFIYTRPTPAPTDITYVVEASGDLAAWSSAGLVQADSIVNAGLQTLTIRDSVPMSGTTKRFMRLRITQP